MLAFAFLLHELQRLGGDLLVDRLHALLRQRAGVRDLPAGKAVDDAARTKLLLERRILEVVRALRLLFGVQVIEVAEELVEPVIGRQHLVTIAKVVLAELARRVALRAQQGGNRRVFGLHALRRAGESHLGEAGADRRLPGDERRAAGRAALLPVPVGEGGTFGGNPVDVGRAVAHQAPVHRADVELADVVAPDHQHVGFPGRRRLGAGDGAQREAQRRGEDRQRCCSFHRRSSPEGIHGGHVTSRERRDWPASPGWVAAR